MVHRHFEDVSNSLACTSWPCRWKMDVGRLAGEQPAWDQNTRTMGLNPECSTAFTFTMIFKITLQMKQEWDTGVHACYISIYNCKCTRTPRLCWMLIHFQISSSRCFICKKSTSKMCLPSTQVLVSKCYFPIKGTKILGKMADSMARQRKYKMILKILWRQRVR